MKPKEIPFWETNLNPITMFAVSAPLRKVLPSEISLSRGSDDRDLTSFVTANYLMQELGVGAKRLKYLCEQIGEYPRYSKMKTYYSGDCLEALKKVVSELEIEPKKIDSELYISNQELMSMFNIKQYKSWKIAQKSTLVKYKMSRNQVYFNRAEAVEFFSKYLKK
jgi:hypothetical protein